MDWLNGLLLLLLVGGNTSLWVEYVNRTHAMPWKCATLHRLRRIHDVMLFLVPLLLIVLLGLTGPRLLLGGSWNSLTTGQWMLVAFCALGCLWQFFVTGRHLLYRPPTLLIDESHQFVDIAMELGHLPVHAGKYSRLASFPMNQQFEVEFNEKTFVLESLPESLAGLSILHVSDWHFMGTVSEAFFERVSELAAAQGVDLVCFTGDLIDSMPCVDWIPQTLGKLQGTYGNYFILGNHDWYQQPDMIRSALSQRGWTDVASRTVEVEINGSKLQIGGDETPWMGSQPAFSSAADFRILFSHTPDNFSAAQASGVDLMLSGHNHGGQVRLPMIGPVYSPSRYGIQYASGIFWKSPTLLHISRGLSGRHPFRYRCRPEITYLRFYRSPPTAE